MTRLDCSALVAEAEAAPYTANRPLATRRGRVILTATAEEPLMPTVTVRFRDLPAPVALVPATDTCETCGDQAPGLIDPSTDVHSCTPCLLDAVRVGAITEIVSVTR